MLRNLSVLNPDTLLDTLVWSLAKQQQTSYRRLAHTSTQVGSYIFIVGGHNAAEYVSDLLMYNLGKIIFNNLYFLYYS
jgi:hypothetical protein